MKLKIAILAIFFTVTVNAAITHDAFGPVKIGERALVTGTLTDTKQIKDARLYFKSNLSEKFSFAELDMNGNSLFANLPAPGPSMSTIEYFFAIKYASGELEKSSVYGLNIDKVWATQAKAKYNKSVDVYSELGRLEGDGLVGFVDDIKTVYQYTQFLDEVGAVADLASYSNYSVVSGPAPSPAPAPKQTQPKQANSSGGGGGVVLGILGGAAAIGGAAYLVGELEEDEIETCDQSFGFEASATSGGFTAKSAWWLSSGSITTGSWDSNSGATYCDTQSAETSYPGSCTDIEAQLESACDSNSYATCRVIYSRPSYLSCY